MALTRWDPFRDLLDMQKEVGRFFNEDAPILKRASSWAPPVDIHETEDSFELSVELPGVKKEDVTLEVKEGIVSVKGERRQEKDVEEKNVHRIERRYGSFYRAFNVPSNVDASRVKAAYKDGVLRITLPKAEEARPRQIEIAA
ncbi:MAG: Hsp20/alpha crystallin family protein [Myxococcota bacterium]